MFGLIELEPIELIMVFQLTTFHEEIQENETLLWKYESIDC